MSWFVQLTLKGGDTIHVRPEHVKAVYAKDYNTVNIVIDGHDFDVQGTIVDILSAVEYHIHPEEY